MTYRWRGTYHALMPADDPSPASAETEGRVISFWMRHEEIEALEADARAHGERRNAALRRLVRDGAVALKQ